MCVYIYVCIYIFHLVTVKENFIKEVIMLS